ncbi:hypothetical protein JCM14036_27260 [Desulfotomaculum defluvii]
MNKLGMFDTWKENRKFFARRSAQSYFGTKQAAMAHSGCGSACGAGDDGKPKSTAFGSACGAGDK